MLPGQYFDHLAKNIGAINFNNWPRDDFLASLFLQIVGLICARGARPTNLAYDFGEMNPWMLTYHWPQPLLVVCGRRFDAVVCLLNTTVVFIFGGWRWYVIGGFLVNTFFMVSAVSSPSSGALLVDGNHVLLLGGARSSLQVANSGYSSYSSSASSRSRLL